jgi:membrane protease YdiL (CAAX protease family)
VTGREAWLRVLLGEPRQLPGLAGARARREWASTAGLAGLLLTYANGDAWLATRREGATSPSANYAHLAMLGVTLAWAAAERLGPRELGLGQQGLGKGLLWGTVIGLLGAIPIRLFFAFPLVSREAVTQPEFQGLSRGRLLWLVTGQFLFGSAIFEEVAFRGLLHAKLLRLMGAGPALLVNSGIFAAWHLVITWYNLRRSNLPRALFPLLYCGALAALFAGGLLFGLLRQATGHLAGSIVAHWLMVANIVLAVARPRREDAG